MDRYARIIVDIAHTNVDRIFEYRIPKGMELCEGVRVHAPFASRVIEGLVLGFTNEPECRLDKIKDIIDIIDNEPIVTTEQVKLAELVRREYRTTLAFALRLMYPAAMRGGRISERSVRMISLKKDADTESLIASCYSKKGTIKAKNKLNALELLKEGEQKSADLDSGVVRKLIDEGAAEEFFVEEYRSPYKPLKGEVKKDVEFTHAQKNAIDIITQRAASGEKHTILLHGVTGSGKTQVYIESIRKVLAMGKTALVLVPEISLTPQLFSVFYAHFGERIAVFHSGLSAGERYDEWRRIMGGEVSIVVGARSSVFMPLKNIGLIIIDEEHEQSYRADNHPPYHAADIARWRTALNSCVLVLASATPRIESYARAKIGMYELVEMPERVRGLGMPEMSVVDMRNEILMGNERTISGPLFKEMKRTLDKGEQIMLFLNRRGFAASVQCVKCGNTVMCGECDIPLKLHKYKGRDVLMCHYCGRIYEYEKVCRACGSRFIRQVGSGTQKVEQEIAELLPYAKVLRMDFDTTRKKDAHREIYESFKAGEADILIGTQMIARGLDFDNVTLAAVVNADTMLSGGDYRSEEKTFSMIEQVGGRAGRKKPGKVMIQTYDPSNYAIRYAMEHDYEGMYEKEMFERRRLIKPPFSTIYRFVFTGKNQARTEQVCLEAESDIKPLIKDIENDILLFIAKSAPVDKLDGQYRYHILLRVIKNDKTRNLKSVLYDVWEKHNKKGINVSLEIDPFDIN